MKKSCSSKALRLEICTAARERTNIEVKASIDALVRVSSSLVIGVFGRGLVDCILVLPETDAVGSSDVVSVTTSDTADTYLAEAPIFYGLRIRASQEIMSAGRSLSLSFPAPA
jgi:hypothetical protein